MGGAMGVFKGHTLEFNSETMWNWDPAEDIYSFDNNLSVLDFNSSGNLIRMKRPSKINYFDKDFIIKLAAFAHRKKADVIVINDFLNMAQLKNLKKELNVFENINHESVLSSEYDIKPMKKSVEIVVLDRLGLILEIFNRRCADELMKIQIALVYLKYAKVLLIREGETFSAIRDILNFNIFNQIGKIEGIKKAGKLELKFRQEES
jgi:50S ribosomal subunit-associated GTPase HflX